jgi:hypothetical protein
VTFVLASVAGCPGGPDLPPTYRVSGHVTYKGKPVTGGVVTFLSDKGNLATGPIEGGRYRLSTFGEQDGAVAGHHQIAVVGTVGDPSLPLDSMPEADRIPDRYADLNQTKMEADVPSRKVTIDLHLD